MLTQFYNSFTETLAGQRKESDSVPVWLMRQAGRYQPAYQELRKEYSFHELSHQSELIKQVTLLPLEYCEVDALIIFSDILVLLEAIGFEFEIKEKLGPIITPEFKPDQLDSINALPASQVFQYVYDAIREVKKASPLPLIGFCGGPFTLASYLIEGKSSKNFSKIKEMMYSFPNAFKRLLKCLTLASIDYLEGCENAGVDAIQIFDTWAEQLTQDQFREFVVPSIEEIAKCCKKPVIYFSKYTYPFLNDLRNLGLSGLSLDHRTPLSRAREVMGKNVILQGNLDPAVLYCKQKVIASRVDQILENYALDPYFIFNLGHGILPDIPLENVQFVVDYVKNWKRR